MKGFPVGNDTAPFLSELIRGKLCFAWHFKWQNPSWEGRSDAKCDLNSCKHLSRTSPPRPPAPSGQPRRRGSCCHPMTSCSDYFSLIVQVSNIQAFLLRIVRREEKAKKNYKGTRMRRLIYPEKTSFYFYYEITYVYVLLIYACIHVPTYIQVGITELLWGLNKIWYTKWLAQYPTPNDHWLTPRAFSTALHILSFLNSNRWMITPPHTMPIHSRRLRLRAVV